MIKQILKNWIIKKIEKYGYTICFTTHNYQWNIKNHGDYVRKSFLEMASKELDHVEGSVAEIGVYQGEFAKFINQVFPNRTFYLFDTFKGFDQRDMDIELNRKFIHRDKTGHLGDTSIEYVKEKMLYPEKCIFKQGYFPETAKGINDQFVFVSIDVDLYKPTIEALNFIYPLLTSPGFMLVHDYNINRYKGATEAVKKFRDDNKLTLVPIGDKGGSAIFVK